MLITVIMFLAYVSNKTPVNHDKENRMKTIISVWEKYKKSINNKYVTELLR